MSDLKLFDIRKKVIELKGSFVILEKSIQTLIENNLRTFFGIKFLASEYSTGKKHAGRIDTLGIDENCFPVIIEYKRSSNENVINQGLYYLDWLMDHKAEFKLLTLDKLGKEFSDKIEWSSPRLICIAGDFSKFDEHSVKQMNRNIELIRYKKYENELLLFELVNAVSVASNTSGQKNGHGKSKTVSDYIEQAHRELKDRYFKIKDYIINLGDDVQEKTLKNYVAFKKILNFVCVEIHPNSNMILLYLKLNPDEVEIIHNFTRDMRKIGHFGTGDLEVRISNDNDFEKAKLLIEKSYENS